MLVLLERFIMMKCPVCEKGELKKGKIKESMFRVYLGEFPAEICSKCHESFTDSETTRKIEEAAKKKGIWGLGKKNIKFINTIIFISSIIVI